MSDWKINASFGKAKLPELWKRSRLLRARLETMKDVCLPGFWSRYICPALRDHSQHPVETNEHYLEFHKSLTELREIRRLMQAEKFDHENRMLILRSGKLGKQIASCFRNRVLVNAAVMDHGFIFRLRTTDGRNHRSVAVPLDWAGPTPVHHRMTELNVGMLSEVLSTPLQNNYGQVLRVTYWTSSLKSRTVFAAKLHDKIYEAHPDTFMDAAELLETLFLDSFKQAIGLD